MHSHPLIQQLQKLKESSRYAIAQGNKYDLDDFKNYLHIEREIEKQLKETIVRSSHSDRAQLILVCGNVGDGKSHVLSHLHKSVPEEISKFQIYNDATEAHNPMESSNDTLYRLLADFKDVNLERSKLKVIVAINLGTLSKFIDTYQDEFHKLKEYIAKEQILDTTIKVNSNADLDSSFLHVNFTNYHIYTLTAEGPISETISELLSKIVAENSGNEIFRGYKEVRDNPDFRKCPVKMNYEFLFEQKNREIITKLLIEAIAKNKEIVSVRSILNFIYDLLVPIQLANSNALDQLNIIKNIDTDELLSCLIPNYIFEHPDLSPLFEMLSELDPCIGRSDTMDELLLSLQSIDNPVAYFEAHIEDRSFKDPFIAVDIKKVNPTIITRYFIRLLYFQHPDLVYKGSYFQEYMENLYHFNRGNHEYLSKLYSLVETAIKRWHGDPKKGDKIVLKAGRTQIKYRIFKDFSIDVDPYIPEDLGQSVLHQFSQEFIVSYKNTTEQNESIKIGIDYSLYRTLKMISKGYRPNKKDNNNFVYFVHFINGITKQNPNASLYIDEVNVGNPIDYKLSKNAFGKYKFEKVS
ncbi:DNA phosphorothioation-dependent restriction protein DptF [Flavobacterium sp. D11R37]|uniref:DNA phosphorothioation-dependent restriction protein DptF n=1 Tax=Flavobacterium coralii TaxID=2838017 RepID=UPI001CA604D0|nr:DNA phosphorothioation-dependent restriction protein DptF [Flavobacterium coralii]MBY8961806.1 DNA phosphorothioation-dependent restriction protein DptF [Flavobacterium coralii]